MRRICLAVFFLLSFRPAWGQRAPVMVNPPGSPLHIVSITCTLSDFLHVVRFKNESGKEIVSFQLGLVMTVPKSCGPHRVTSQLRNFSPDRITVLPGGEAQTGQYRFDPLEVQDFAHKSEAQEVFSQVTVIQATHSATEQSGSFKA